MRKDDWLIDWFIFMIIFYCKHTYLHLYFIQQLRYPREALQFFTYIPWGHLNDKPLTRSSEQGVAWKGVVCPSPIISRNIIVPFYIFVN